MKNKIRLMVLLSILTIGLTGCTFYDKFADKDETAQENQNQNQVLSAKFFDDDIDLLHNLINKDSLEELTNQEKLYILINTPSLSSRPNSFGVSDLEKIYSKSVISELGIKYEDILDTYDSFNFLSSDTTPPYYTYKDSYYEKTVLGHGTNFLGIILNKKLVSYEEKDGKYYISYKYVFGNATGDGPMPISLYYNGKDAVNKENSFKLIGSESDINQKEEAKEYIEKNYSSIEPELSTYTYIFEFKEDHFIITGFSVK